MTQLKSIEKVTSQMSDLESVIRQLELFINGIGESRYYKDYVVNIKCIARDRLLHFINNQVVYKKWRNTFREINKEILVCPRIQTKNKLRFIIALCKAYPLLKSYLKNE